MDGFISGHFTILQTPKQGLIMFSLLHPLRFPLCFKQYSTVNNFNPLLNKSTKY